MMAQGVLNCVKGGIFNLVLCLLVFGLRRLRVLPQKFLVFARRGALPKRIEASTVSAIKSKL